MPGEYTNPDDRLDEPVRPGSFDKSGRDDHRTGVLKSEMRRIAVEPGAEPGTAVPASTLVRDAYGRDELGFVAERCPHCNAHLHLRDELAARGGSPLCLNGCTLPGYLYRRLNSPNWLADAANIAEEKGE